MICGSCRLDKQDADIRTGIVNPYTGKNLPDKYYFGKVPICDDCFNMMQNITKEEVDKKIQDLSNFLDKHPEIRRSIAVD